MGYTMSFDASVKVQRGSVAGFLHHTARDIDREQGREVRHGNQDIDAARTCDNATLVSDGAGRWKPCEDVSEIETALDNRLKAVKRPLRKDAVVLRPLILQLDPEWYASHSSDEEQERAASVMMEWAADTFGADNLISVSLHNDENAPHLHVLFCPVTEDGRLSQKDWFSSPAQLRKMHQDLRQHMMDAGYDIEMENRKPGKHAKRMSEREYKDFRELQNEARKIDAQQGQLNRWAQRLHEQQTEQQEREKALADREREMQRREAAQKARETALEGRRRAVEAREAALPGLAAKAAKEAVQGEIEASRAAHRRPSSAAAERDAAQRLQAALAGVQAVCDAVELHQAAQQHNSSKTLSPV